MRIDRINTYDDNRFSQEALYQHGCYIVDGDVPVEIKIISQTEALIKGGEAYFDEVIEEFRFNAEHITNFYDESGKLIKKFKDVEVFKLDLDKIQPIQFFIDSDKLEAVKSFVNREEDVIIPVTKREDTYASLETDTHASTLHIALDSSTHTPILVKPSVDLTISFMKQEKEIYLQQKT